MPRLLIAFLLGALAAAAVAKLPPLTPDQKAAADQAKAKAAYAAKRDAFDLCRAMERVAAGYAARSATAGKPAKASSTPACEDPGPYVAPTAATGKS